MGCDNVLGSRKTLDACGVCDGDNSSCENVISKFQRKLRRGQFRRRTNWVIRRWWWSFHHSRIVKEAKWNGTPLISLKGEEWRERSSQSSPPGGMKLCVHIFLGIRDSNRENRAGEKFYSRQSDNIWWFQWFVTCVLNTRSNCNCRWPRKLWEKGRQFTIIIPKLSKFAITSVTIE